MSKCEIKYKILWKSNLKKGSQFCPIMANITHFWPKSDHSAVKLTRVLHILE